MTRANTEADFWARLRHDDGAECWPFVGSTADGYGTIKYQGLRWRAHRLAYRLFHGSIPIGMWILHSCDNRICCNPAHLWPGDAKQNAQDMMQKGRWRGPPVNKSPNAKLTPDAVMEIRRSPSSCTELSRKFGVSIALISQTKRRKTWRHVT